jgi:hypothetical protein
MRDTDVLVELALLVRSIRWLAQFRDRLTYAERLRIGEAMRDAADEGSTEGSSVMPRMIFEQREMTMDRARRGKRRTTLLPDGASLAAFGG